MLNGVEAVSIGGKGESGSSNSILLPLNLGDEVWLQLMQGSLVETRDRSRTGWSSFSGYRIGRITLKDIAPNMKINGDVTELRRPLRPTNVHHEDRYTEVRNRPSHLGNDERYDTRFSSSYRDRYENRYRHPVSRLGSVSSSRIPERTHEVFYRPSYRDRYDKDRLGTRNRYEMENRNRYDKDRLNNRDRLETENRNRFDEERLSIRDKQSENRNRYPPNRYSTLDERPAVIRFPTLVDRVRSEDGGSVRRPGQNGLSDSKDCDRKAGNIGSIGRWRTAGGSSNTSRRSPPRRVLGLVRVRDRSRERERNPFVSLRDAAEKQRRSRN